MMRLDSERRRLVTQLVGVAFQAGRILLHGPWGVGKTTLVLEAARTAREAGLRVGYRARTRALSDVVAALEHAYGGEASEADTEQSARQRKSAVRMATARHAGLLVLDGFRASGTALVGFLRSLRGKQLAVIAVADVEHPRDLIAARAAGVAYRELVVPPLPPRELLRLQDHLSAKLPLPSDLRSADRLALVDLARGRPGVLERAWGRLRERRYWQGSSPLVEMVRADLRLEWLAEMSAARPRGRAN